MCAKGVLGVTADTNMAGVYSKGAFQTHEVAGVPQSKDPRGKVAEQSWTDTEPTIDEPSDVELVRCARAGDERAIVGLLERYRGYAKRKARPYFLAGSDRDDVVQEAMIGLFKAIRDFDLAQDTPFRAFAELCISRQVLTAIKSANRNKHRPLNSSLSLDAPAHAADDEGINLGDSIHNSSVADPAELIASAEAIEALRDSMKQSLTDLEKGVLALYVDGKSYEEIAEALGNHSKSIDNALQRIKRKVRGHLQSG